MKTLFLSALTLIAITSITFADNTWILEKSKLAYHANHPFHNTVGKTSAAKGKGVCGKQGCDFLVAVPVKTFESGDDNRDLHMQQAVHAGTAPLVSMKTHTPTEPTGKFQADLQIDFGGKQFIYKDVALEVTDKSADRMTVKGTIPLLLSNHNVERPSLMGVAIKDSAPVDVEATWVKK